MIKTIIYFVLFVYLVFGDSKSKSKSKSKKGKSSDDDSEEYQSTPSTTSTNDIGNDTPNMTPSIDDLCQCYQVDIVSQDALTVGDDICYYYIITTSNEDFCEPIDALSLFSHFHFINSS